MMTKNDGRKSFFILFATTRGTAGVLFFVGFLFVCCWQRTTTAVMDMRGGGPGSYGIWRRAGGGVVPYGRGHRTSDLMMMME